MLRKARLSDVKAIQKRVNFYARKNRMLPLSLAELYENIRDFFVYEERGRIVGCGALKITWERLGEIRSLAVQKNKRKKGIGKKIVRMCLKEAAGLGLKDVFVLSYSPEYFRRLGFKDIDKYQLPHKVWSDCVKCIHFPDCKEDALIKNIS